jgi:hypothetical protein
MELRGGRTLKDIPDRIGHKRKETHAGKCGRHGWKKFPNSQRYKTSGITSMAGRRDGEGSQEMTLCRASRRQRQHWSLALRQGRSQKQRQRSAGRPAGSGPDREEESSFKVRAPLAPAAAMLGAAFAGGVDAMGEWTLGFVGGAQRQAIRK